MVVGRAAGLTDTGRRRRQNEDAFVCDPPLFAIADGMGGAQAGELASRLAAAAIEEAAPAVSDEEGVVDVVRVANARIFERSLRDPAVAGMGTTATVALVDEQTGTLTLAHVGDSRAYRYRAAKLEQLTTDHSLVAELVRSGRLTEAEAAVHPHRSVITRALGTEAGRRGGHAHPRRRTRRPRPPLLGRALRDGSGRGDRAGARDIIGRSP